MKPTLRPVLLYDGQCGFCDRTVQRLLRWDSAGKLSYAPLQGIKAHDFLRGRGLPTDFSTVILVSDWNDRDAAKVFIRSSAIVESLKLCGGDARLVGYMLWLVPRPLRDVCYRLVAYVRYRLLSPPNACRIPRPEWRARFLADDELS